MLACCMLEVPATEEYKALCCVNGYHEYQKESGWQRWGIK